MEWQNQDPQPKRWGRVVDVVSDGILYMEDAERLKLNGVVFPADFKRRSIQSTISYISDCCQNEIRDM